MVNDQRANKLYQMAWLNVRKYLFVILIIVLACLAAISLDRGWLNTVPFELVKLAYHQIVDNGQQTGTASISERHSITITGPLQVNSANPRYLTDGSGNAIILAGSNYWNAMQDGGHTNPPPAFDFNAFVNFLVGHGMNYTKAHVWEQSWHQSNNQDWYIAPTIYARTGPGNALDGGLKFNLNELNPVYFDRLRSRVIQYGQNNIYVTINIFDRFSIQDGNTMTNQWLGHPFNTNNNINGINGDPMGQGNGLDTETLIIPSITSYQEAYVQHFN